MQMCMEHVPYAKTFQDMVNLRMAGRLAWEEKEMGGIEHVMFARRNDTPIVPIGHCGFSVGGFSVVCVHGVVFWFSYDFRRWFIVVQIFSITCFFFVFFLPFGFRNIVQCSCCYG